MTPTIPEQLAALRQELAELRQDVDELRREIGYQTDAAEQYAENAEGEDTEMASWVRHKNGPIPNPRDDLEELTELDSPYYPPRGGA